MWTAYMKAKHEEDWSTHWALTVRYFESIILYSEVEGKAALYIAGHFIFFPLKIGTNKICLCKIWQPNPLTFNLIKPHYHTGTLTWELVLPGSHKVHQYTTHKPSRSLIITLTDEDSTLEYKSIVSWLRTGKTTTSKKKIRDTWAPIKKLLYTHTVQAYYPVYQLPVHKQPRQQHNRIEPMWGPMQAKRIFFKVCDCAVPTKEYFSRTTFKADRALWQSYCEEIAQRRPEDERGIHTLREPFCRNIRTQANEYY